MRLRPTVRAAGTALLALALLATPAAAAQGEVVVGSSSSHPQSVENPAAGACVSSFAALYGSAVDNLTNAVVDLYGTTDCRGRPVATLAPGESRSFSLDTQIAAIRARS